MTKTRIVTTTALTFSALIAFTACSAGDNNETIYKKATMITGNPIK